MFNNLSSLQRNFIRNCFIFLGVIAWLAFGFISVANEWELCCLIFLAPFFSLALFIVVMGIYIFIIRLRFKWQIMGVLTKEEYSSVIHELCYLAGILMQCTMLKQVQRFSKFWIRWNRFGMIGWNGKILKIFKILLDK